MKTCLKQEHKLPVDLRGSKASVLGALIRMEAINNNKHFQIGALICKGAYRNRGAKSDHYGSSTRMLTRER